MAERKLPREGRTDPYEALSERFRQFHALPGHRQMRLRLWFSGPDSKFDYIRRRHAMTGKVALLGIVAGLVMLAELFGLFTNFWVRAASGLLVLGCLIYQSFVRAEDEMEMEMALLAAHYDDVCAGRVDGRDDWPGPLA